MRREFSKTHSHSHSHTHTLTEYLLAIVPLVLLARARALGVELDLLRVHAIRHRLPALRRRLRLNWTFTKNIHGLAARVLAVVCVRRLDAEFDTTLAVRDDQGCIDHKCLPVAVAPELLLRHEANL